MEIPPQIPMGEEDWKVKGKGHELIKLGDFNL